MIAVASANSDRKACLQAFGGDGDATAMSSNTQSGMALRNGTVDDAATAATLHAGQIGEGFLSMLGRRFLRRLYRRVARSPGSFLLVVEDGGDTVGFLAGSTDVAGLYRSFLVRDGAAAMLACGPRLLGLGGASWRLFATATTIQPTVVSCWRLRSIRQHATKGRERCW